MATAGETWEPPLLSWKGMQLWSVGCRAPAFCEIFVGLKGKKLSNLISTNSQKKGKRRKRREGEDGTNLSEESEAPVAHTTSPPPPPPPPRRSSLQLSCRSSLDDVPTRHSISFEERCSVGRITNQVRRNSDATASNLKPISDILRRNSDASVCNMQRLSTTSSSPCGGYERVWVLEGGDDGGLDYMLPREVKLGGRRSDASALVQLGRQDSGMSAHRRSSCSSFSSSSSSVASAASTAAAKLASRCSSESLMSQLVVGNQFLTHLTAAPVATATDHMRPSHGFLLDASVRCREAELKDRIIFFL